MAAPKKNANGTTDAPKERSRNAKAQHAHRERKKIHIANLELRSKQLYELEIQYAALQTENYELQQQLRGWQRRALEAEEALFVARNMQMAGVTATQPHPPAHPMQPPIAIAAPPPAPERQRSDNPSPRSSHSSGESPREGSSHLHSHQQYRPSFGERNTQLKVENSPTSARTSLAAENSSDARLRQSHRNSPTSRNADSKGTTSGNDGTNPPSSSKCLTPNNLGRPSIDDQLRIGGVSMPAGMNIVTPNGTSALDSSAAQRVLQQQHISGFSPRSSATPIGSAMNTPFSVPQGLPQPHPPSSAKNPPLAFLPQYGADGSRGGSTDASPTTTSSFSIPISVTLPSSSAQAIAHHQQQSARNSGQDVSGLLQSSMPAIPVQLNSHHIYMPNRPRVQS